MRPSLGGEVSRIEDRRANKKPQPCGLRFFLGSGGWIRTNDLRVMSPNLGVGLFDRSSGRFSLARQTSVPISPQDFGHTFVTANLANNGYFVKHVNGPRTLALACTH